ncbi:hypothetical protein EYC80_002676 [Monilinia laxa]|uniref:Uncharacterized protein n=1 Tax=Monilinia laxa TaxID=61186 RepID=A0A5N6K4U8_MONLA|nr:hypothetical protein EYC80_002676 [Monilinia laxa]
MSQNMRMTRGWPRIIHIPEHGRPGPLADNISHRQYTSPLWADTSSSSRRWFEACPGGICIVSKQEREIASILTTTCPSSEVVVMIHKLLMNRWTDLSGYWNLRLRFLYDSECVYQLGRRDISLAYAAMITTGAVHQTDDGDDGGIKFQYDQNGLMHSNGLEDEVGNPNKERKKERKR